MKNISLKISLLSGALLALMLLCHSTAKGVASLAGQYPFFQKGMSYAAWSRDSFSTPISDESLKTMSTAGVNCVAIVTTWYQEDFNSTHMKPTDRTPSDASLKHAIKKAHELGMAVMLKPHIDLVGMEGSNRSDIGFNSEDGWKEWFSGYSAFIRHYAEMAEEEDVEFLCIGTELSFAASKKEYWKTRIIPEIRAIFHGRIIYAANWDEYKDVGFWDELDYIGIDAYFPLSKKDNPTLGELKKGWKTWLGEIESFQKKVNKPVIFSESGYCSSGDAARKPWEEAVVGEPNLELQANCYKALFETFWDKPWFFGVYWWSWSTSPMSGGPANRRFTPQNKPALEYVKLWYSQPSGMKLAFGKKDSPAGDAELAERMELEAKILSQKMIEGVGKIAFVGEMAEKKEGSPASKNTDSNQ